MMSTKTHKSYSLSGQEDYKHYWGLYIELLMI